MAYEEVDQGVKFLFTCKNKNEGKKMLENNSLICVSECGTPVFVKNQYRDYDKDPEYSTERKKLMDSQGRKKGKGFSFYHSKRVEDGDGEDRDVWSKVLLEVSKNLLDEFNETEENEKKNPYEYVYNKEIPEKDGFHKYYEGANDHFFEEQFKK